MQLTIDIDMNQIDYDAINEQIKEKLSNLTPEDVFKKYYYTDDSIADYIRKVLKDGSEDYIVTRGWCSSDHSIDKINDLAKQIMRERLEPMCDKMMEDFTPEEINELFIKLFPMILCDIWYEDIKNRTYGAEATKQAKTRDFVVSMIQSEFERRSMR